jgi:hypothetical protein
MKEILIWFFKKLQKLISENFNEKSVQYFLFLFPVSLDLFVKVLFKIIKTLKPHFKRSQRCFAYSLKWKKLFSGETSEDQNQKLWKINKFSFLNYFTLIHKNIIWVFIKENQSLIIIKFPNKPPNNGQLVFFFQEKQR